MRALEREVTVSLERGAIAGSWTLPTRARGVVVFAHDTGCSRRSARNRFVAGVLQEAGYATLVLDLLTEEEEDEESLSGYLRFDVALLTERLLAGVSWVARSEAAELPLGVFGVSTGAAAALRVAAERPEQVQAVVSRGGRPDLAGESLHLVRAPTLFVVGGDDDVVVTLNERAMHHLQAHKQLVVVPHATRLFEEPGALERVADLARQWFERFLSPSPEVVVRQ